LSRDSQLITFHPQSWGPFLNRAALSSPPHDWKNRRKIPIVAPCANRVDLFEFPSPRAAFCNNSEGLRLDANHRSPAWQREQWRPPGDERGYRPEAAVAVVTGDRVTSFSGFHVLPFLLSITLSLLTTCLTTDHCPIPIPNSALRIPHSHESSLSITASLLISCSEMENDQSPVFLPLDHLLSAPSDGSTDNGKLTTDKEN
jgi:hypothetical protein